MNVLFHASLSFCCVDCASSSSSFCKQWNINGIGSETNNVDTNDKSREDTDKMNMKVEHDVLFSVTYDSLDQSNIAVLIYIKWNNISCTKQK